MLLGMEMAPATLVLYVSCLVPCAVADTSPCTVVEQLFLEPTYGHSSPCICRGLQHLHGGGWQLAVMCKAAVMRLLVSMPA